MASTAGTINNPGKGSATDLEFQTSRTLGDGSVARQSATAGDWGFQSLTASGTTVVKTGAGQLGLVVCGTATGNITIYDNTAASGTKILDACALAVGYTPWNISFGTGLTVVLSGAGVASVTYK